MFTRCAMGAGTSKLAVQGDIVAGEGTKGELARGKVGAKAAVGRVAEIVVEFFRCISACPLFGVSMKSGKGGGHSEWLVVCCGRQCRGVVECSEVDWQ